MAALREIGQGLIDPKYCCVAVPLVNWGIYAILGEQLIVSIAAGLLAVTTPKVVGAWFPSFTTYIFAVCCWLIAILQPVGFIGILREKTKTFKIYSWFNLIFVAFAFITSGALIVVSGLNHTRAVNSCITSYFTPTAGDTASASAMLEQQGPLLCRPFAWADIGIMGGLWVLLLVTQAYFIYITKTYSRSQVSDHKLYHSVYSENPEAFTMSILQSKRYNPGSVYSTGGPGGLPVPRMSAYAARDDAWDARASSDSLKKDGMQSGQEYGQYDHDHGYAPGGLGYASGSGQGHEQQGQGQGQGQGYGQEAYGYGAQQPMRAGEYGGGDGRYDDAPRYEGGEYGQGQGYSHGQNYSYGEPGVPDQAAYGREPGPTPTMNRFNSGDGVGFQGDGGLSRPQGVQNHPAEGMFGRKSPRG